MPGTTIVNPNDPAVIGAILHTIRQTETGGNYSLQGPIGGGSSACGAYAILDSTWRNWCKSVPGACSYARACNAPPNVQDAVAAVQVKNILAKNGNVLESVPASWYVGFYQPGGKYWNTIPAPGAGNKASVSQYIDAHWMPNFNKFKGQVNTTPGATTTSSLVPGPGDFLPGGQFSLSDLISNLTKPLQLLFNAFQWAADPHNWYRVFEVIAGAILVFIGAWSFLKDTKGGEYVGDKVHEAKTGLEVAAV